MNRFFKSLKKSMKQALQIAKKLKKKPTDNAVEILHRRYVKNDPKILEELEKFRNEED